MPGQTHIGISKKIENWEEKRRLKKILWGFRQQDFGLIARTVAEGVNPRDCKNDIKDLIKQWNNIQKLARKRNAPCLLHRDVDLLGSVLRDQITSEVDSVVVDRKDTFKKIMKQLKSVAPSLRSKVRLYEEKIPLFDAMGIEVEIEKMFIRKIWVKRGAYIVIDQTEALVTIDVNTGRFVGKQSQEDTIFKTNVEAAREIARQIRLRDIGGLIIVDFIDMTSRENERRLYEEFRSGFREDRAKCAFGPVTEFGLIEMTREKTRPSLVHELSEPCPLCDGAGRVLSKETVALKIERWFKRARAVAEEYDYRLVTHPLLAEVLASEKDNRLKKIARELRLNISLDTDKNLKVDEFQVFSVAEGRDITERFKLVPTE